MEFLEGLIWITVIPIIVFIVYPRLIEVMEMVLDLLNNSQMIIVKMILK